MNRISFTLPIEPRSLQFGGKRIRIIANPRRPGKLIPMHFSDDKAKAFKRDLILMCLPHKPARPIEGPVHLSLTFVVARPASLKAKRHPDGRVWSTTRPDSTNFCKIVEDLLTKSAFWNDDNQVARHTLEKFYAARNEPPCIEVGIERI